MCLSSFRYGPLTFLSSLISPSLELGTGISYGGTVPEYVAIVAAARRRGDGQLESETRWRPGTPSRADDATPGRKRRQRISGAKTMRRRLPSVHGRRLLVTGT